MKLRSALYLLTVPILSLSADFNDDVFSADDTSTFDLSPGGVENNQGPVTIRASFDYVGEANFTRHPMRHEKIQFSEYDLDGSLVFYYNPCRKEGVALQAGFTRYNVDWKQNPYFDENEYNMFSVGLGFFTARAWRWEWKGLAKVNFNTDHWDVQRYSTFDFLLWGRFELATDWGFHAGALALTGMKIDRVYPIFGLDYTLNPCWKFNAIFPLNFSVIYTPSDMWAFSLQSRFWDVRQRTGRHEPLCRAVWEYRNFGAELGATFKRGGFTANAHAGYTFGGTLKIYSHNTNNSKRFKFDGAPYVGGEVAYNF